MIRIVIAEDQPMLLDALGSLLDLEENMKVVGKASNGEEALSLVKQYQPDICITDIEMPLKSGLDVAEELKNHSCKIIILTTFARTGYFERARKAGVSGYLLKDGPSEDLVNSLRIIMNGGRVYAPELVDIAEDNPLVEQKHQEPEDAKKTKGITGDIYSNYISVFLDKLDVSNRMSAISRFKETGRFK